jgi:hypothetical protein
MKKCHIIFVPGKNPKPPAEQHKELLWRVLVEGVKRAAPDADHNVEHFKNNFVVAAWNYLYYKESKDINRDLPWIDALLNQHGPTEKDIEEADSTHYHFLRFVYSIVDYLPFLLHFVPGRLKSTAEEVRRYFKNEDYIARNIRAVLKEQLRPLLKNNEKVLLIGHSLGSVIAYDTLWELSHQEHIHSKVDLFLTLGSPLGMNYVQSHLKGSDYKNEMKYPANIKRWVNVAAEGDITALDREFADDFSNMVKLNLLDEIEDHCHGIYNFFRNEEGLNAHRSYGYLVNPAVGKVIADWCRENDR